MNDFLEFALIGTTASGKTDLANEIAKDLNAIVLSLDSLCIYKELDIISAKPTKEEIQNIRYIGIDEINLNEHFSVGLFIKLYQKAKKLAQDTKSPLIITGGTSFYLKTMLDGLSDEVKECTYPIDIEKIYKQISQEDPSYKVAPNDTYRIRKYQSIKDHIMQNNFKDKNNNYLTPSQFLKDTKKEPVIENITIFDIVLDRKYLLEKISKRTEKMLKMGAIDECVRLYEKYGDCKPLACIGAKECLEYHKGLYGYDELVYKINTHTAQLAKRQRTFNKKFKSISNYHVLNSADKTEIYKILNISNF